MILTFDIEDWYNYCGITSLEDPKTWNKFPSHIEKNTDFILDLLEAKNIIATFFIVGAQAKRYPKLIQRIQRGGHKIGSHGMNHLNVRSLSENEFKNEILDSKNTLEDILGSEINSYRAPEFSMRFDDINYYNLLADCGYKTSSSVRQSLFTKNSESVEIKTTGNSITEYSLGCVPLGNVLIPITGGTYLKLIPKFLVCFLPLLDTMIYAHPHDFAKKTPKHPEIGMIKNFLRSRQIGHAYSEKITILIKNQCQIHTI